MSIYSHFAYFMDDLSVVAIIEYRRNNEYGIEHIGNQPIQHMIYLYNYIGQPWKAQYWLRQVMNRMYTPGPDGYCGDEDNGQTSAWYVFSALGFCRFGSTSAYYKQQTDSP